MDTNKIKVFLTYAATLNLRETAELHHTSHVHVLRILRSLENEIGTQLRQKVGSRSVLTPVGKSLIRYAKDFLSEEKKFLNACQEIEVKETSSVKIATFEVFSTHLAPEINAAIGLETEIAWLDRLPGAIEQAVKNENATLGITYEPISTDGIEHVEVTSIAMGIYQSMHSSHKHEKIRELPFVVPLQENFLTPSRTKGLDGWPDHRITRNIRYSVSHLESALSMVAHNQCIGFFPRFIASRYNKGRDDLKIKLIENTKIKSQRQSVFLVKRREDSESLIVRKVARVLRSLASQ